MEGKSIHGQKTWHLGDFTRGQTLKQKPSTPRGKKSVKRGVLHSGGVKGHHMAKLCRAKLTNFFESDENFPNKVSPNKIIRIYLNDLFPS